jgi:hypothetical protein
MQLRWGDGATASDAMTKLDAVLTEITTMFRLITITGARARQASVNITLPVTWSGAATYGSGAGTHDESAKYLDFIGRSPGGRRVRLSVFGLITAVDGSGHDYRIASTDDANVAAAVIELNADAETAVAIDGEKPIWYPFVDVGENAYWRNRIR